MDQKSSEPRHLDFVDSVRGIAFLGVFVCHAGLAVTAFPGQTLTAMGRYGVQLFFLASAFTLCHSMASRQKADRLLLASFYIRRFFRIAPMFWLGMALYWFLSFPAVHLLLSHHAPDGFFPSYFVLTALFLQGWLPHSLNSIVPGGWSIAVETTFYLIFPFCFFFLKPVKKLVGFTLFWLCCSTAIYYGVWPWLQVHVYGSPAHPLDLFNSLYFKRHWFPAQFHVFLIGILLYYLLLQKPVQALMRERFWRRSLLAACIGTFFFWNSIGMPPVPIDVLSLAGAIAALSGETARWLINSLLTGLGKISYSCYLLHFAALDLALRLFGPRLDPTLLVLDTGRPWGNAAAFCVLCAIALPLTVLFSTISYHLVEKPGIALGRRLVKRINARPPAAARLEE